jgi:hypothetical protein
LWGPYLTAWEKIKARNKRVDDIFSRQSAAADVLEQIGSVKVDRHSWTVSSKLANYDTTAELEGGKISSTGRVSIELELPADLAADLLNIVIDYNKTHKKPKED